jgi:type VI secretion system protein ImpM
MPDLSLGVPAWFGKLPGTGDFAYRRLDRQFQETWDEWLQGGLLDLRDRYADWVTPYLNAPMWFFALGQGVIGMKPWVGVMIPSVDSVGRYFPLTLINSLPENMYGHNVESHKKIAHWWSCCAQYASTALDNDLDASAFDSLLQTGFLGMLQANPMYAPMMQSFPLPGCSSWISNSGEYGLQAFTLAGLPRDHAFGTLFGCDADETTQRQEL